MKSLSVRMQESLILEAVELSKDEFLKIKGDMKAKVAEKMYFLEANAKVLGRFDSGNARTPMTISYYEYEGSFFETIVTGEAVWNVTEYKSLKSLADGASLAWKIRDFGNNKLALKPRNWRKANDGEHSRMYTWAYPEEAYD